MAGGVTDHPQRAVGLRWPYSPIRCSLRPSDASTRSPTEADPARRALDGKDARLGPRGWIRGLPHPGFGADLDDGGPVVGGIRRGDRPRDPPLAARPEHGRRRRDDLIDGRRRKPGPRNGGVPGAAGGMPGLVQPRPGRPRVGPTRPLPMAGSPRLRTRCPDRNDPGGQRLAGLTRTAWGQAPTLGGWTLQTTTLGVAVLAASAWLLVKKPVPETPNARPAALCMALTCAQAWILHRHGHPYAGTLAVLLGIAGVVGVGASCITRRRPAAGGQ